MQMFQWVKNTSWLVTLCVISACGGTDFVAIDSNEIGNPDPTDPEIVAPLWEIKPFNAQPILLTFGDSVTVGVTVTRDGRPVESERIDWELLPPSGDASLDATTSYTYRNGNAGIDLLAGTQAADFMVMATHFLAGKITLTVSVVEPDRMPASLLVGVVYGSQDRWPVSRVEVAVHDGKVPCDVLTTLSLLPPSLAEDTLQNVVDTLTFTSLSGGQNVTVFARGLDANGVVASGCSSGVELIDGEETGVVVRLAPFGLDVTGVYDVAQSYDFGNALPAGFGGVATILGQLFDDPDDPARFLVDFVEARLGFSFGFVKNAIIDLVDTYVQQVLPQGVQDLFARIGEAARLVTAFSVDTTIVIEADDTGNLTATETWETITFVWEGAQHRVDMTTAGLDPVEAIYPVELVDDERLDIALHSFEIPFMGMYRVALTNIVYPSIGGGATTTQDLLASVLDCAAVAAEMDAGDGIVDGYFTIGISIPVSTLEIACNDGLGFIADQIDAQLDSLGGNGPQILTRQGVTTLDGENASRQPMRLVDGAWTGDLAIDGQTSIISGLFSGDRR